MIGLYSRVVYALGFKENDGNQLTQQQKVSLVRGGNSLMKRSGMHVEEFDINPKGDRAGRGPSFI